MSDAPQGPGWWQASDGKWYAPEQHPDHTQAMGQTPTSGGAPTPGSQPPGSGPSGYAGGPPAGMPPTMGGTPPSGGPPEKKGSKVPLIIGGVVLVLVLIGVAIFALSGDDDDGDDDVAASTSTTEVEEEDEEPTERTLVPPSDDEDDDEPTTTTTEDDDLEADLGGLGLDADQVDPATLRCVGQEVEANPDLADALESDVASDPTSPEFRELFVILTDCGARDYLEDSFTQTFTASQAACVDEAFATLSDDEFIDLILGLAAEDLSAADPILHCLS